MVGVYYPRLVEEHFVTCSRTFPVVMVTGARQVGKTTLARELGAREHPERGYVSLDEYGPRTLALEDPELFLQHNPPRVTIDEVQHAPHLLAAIKPMVDRSRAMGQVWLTGSQAFPLMRAVSESLAGRVAVVDLAGLSLGEVDGRASPRAPFRPDRLRDAAPTADVALRGLFETIVGGSFPRLRHPDPPPLDTFYGSYLQTYVERDVRAMLHVASLTAFQRFLRLVAARVGALLNLSDLARDAGVAVNTAKDWLAVLEATHQVMLLRPYFENLSKRQIKTPKLYMMDTGLACHLTGWRTPESASSGAMAGALLENFVVVEIWKSWRYRGLVPPLWFYRDKEKNEVDLIIAEDGVLFPVEVKLTASPNRRDLGGIEALRRTGAHVGHGAVACLVPRPIAIDNNVDAFPVGWIA